MFEKDYNTEMEKISPSNECKEKILQKLNLTPPTESTLIEKKEKMLRSRNAWRIGFAVTAALAIAASAVFIPLFRSKKVSSLSEPIIKAKSYNEIYKKINNIISEKSNTSFWRTTNDEKTSEYVLYDDTGTDQETVGTGTEDFSETNIQVEGVEEADVVKTDGKYLYVLADNKIQIISAVSGITEKISEIDPDISVTSQCNDFYLVDGKITAIINCLSANDYGSNTESVDRNRSSNTSIAVFFDVSDPASPKELGKTIQSGELIDSRMIGNRLYLITNHTVNGSVEKNKPESYVPHIGCNGTGNAVPADSICIRTADEYEPIYTVIGIYNTENGELLDTQSLLGGSSDIYCNENTLITAISDYTNNYSSTIVSYFSFAKDTVDFEASTAIKGTLLNQFSMDERNGYFRFVTTVNDGTTKESETADGLTLYEHTLEKSVSLTILDRSLKTVSALNNLANDERVYSVRFMGDIVYFVTFRETDPLFSVDLSDPENPTVLGILKIPGFSNYLFPYGNGKLLGIGMEVAADEGTELTECLKLSMFDISDPANVTENDKYLLENSQYSPALYNHKASLVSPDKNLIGFEARNYNDVNTGCSYELFRYENSTFTSLASFELTAKECFCYTGVRGLFIEDIFYLVTSERILSYSLDNFTLLSELKL